MNEIEKHGRSSVNNAGALPDLEVILTMHTGAVYSVTFKDEESRDMFLTDLEDGVTIYQAANNESDTVTAPDSRG